MIKLTHAEVCQAVAYWLSEHHNESVQSTEIFLCLVGRDGKRVPVSPAELVAVVEKDLD